MTELSFEAAQQVLDSQPFSGHVGARITEFGDGGAVLEVDVREELTQQNGFLHGGVLSYAADNALTFAAGTTLGPAVLTGGFSIQYVRPASGRTLLERCPDLALAPSGGPLDWLPGLLMRGVRRLPVSW